ncbi:SpoIID/LytB domain-containing protein [Marvinbryantia formatexigens]|nr:SpoIID/LytB domain-containing protein [Marvinbryantia formatexigens]UWO26303.1 SpoIID/LytB domain-containing protein [Marvinbryantia formatexigens DSM 14469]SDG08547.1 stage II sporulation protein D [Marvinbryantia formatexigens]
MKKRIEYILTGILVMLVLPCAMMLLLDGRMSEIYRSIKNETDYITVKTNSGALEMELEEYVIGVTAAQIPAGYDLEAVKAQMVAARTNLYRQIEADGKVESGAYLTMTELERMGSAEKFLRAQRETRGQVLEWEGRPILASFHACSAGNTRDAKEVLRTEEYPYLVSKVCPSDTGAADAETTLQIDSSWADMQITERDSTGYVLQISLDGKTMSGEEFRNLLGLPSANFEVSTTGGETWLTVHGIGHGLGMSQYTAQQMALTGKDYKEILAYFYPGTDLIKY